MGDMGSFLAMSEYRKKLFASGTLGESRRGSPLGCQNLLKVQRDPSV